MSYRILRPQGNVGESSASTSGPSNSTSELRGAEDLAGSSSSTKLPKRRKVPQPGTVTKNACSNCKRARTKCDGQTPCSRCSTRGETNCTYEIHVKHAKEEMMQTIKEHQARERMTEKIFSAIASGSEHIPSIIRGLQAGDSVSTVAESLSALTEDPPDSRVGDSLSPRNSIYSGIDSPDYEMGFTPEGFQWTTVTADERVFRHLFSLYFSWVHPIHTLFHEGSFVNSYKTRSEKHCSHVLVNAICAMACQLHTKQENIRDHVDYGNLGSLFMDLARSLVRPEIEDLTTVQALAIMFLADYSRGQGYKAFAYLRIATGILSRMKLPPQNESLEGYWQDTVCGTQNLNIEWAQMTFQAPASSLHVPLEFFTQDMELKDESHWYYYRFEADEVPAWPCVLATTVVERAKLTAIIRDVTELHHGYQRDDISATQVLEQHKRYMSWRNYLSASVGDIENHSQAMPHVLTMLILFHTAVTQLLRPILSLNELPRETMMAVEEEAWRHAQIGLYLLERHYRTHWTCRYQPVQQLFCALHLCDIVARFFPGRTERSSKDGMEAVQLAIEVFYESRQGFAIAGQFQEALVRVASDYSFDLPEETKRLMLSHRIVYDMDDTIEACGNASFLQPVNEILARYQPSFSHDWALEAPAYGFREKAEALRRRIPMDSAESAAENLMRIRNLLNTS